MKQKQNRISNQQKKNASKTKRKAKKKENIYSIEIKKTKDFFYDISLNTSNINNIATT
jgi:hypothetical protein